MKRTSSSSSDSGAGRATLPDAADSPATLTLYRGKAPPPKAICLDRPVLVQILAVLAPVQQCTAVLPNPWQTAAVVKKLFHQINL